MATQTLGRRDMTIELRVIMLPYRVYENLYQICSTFFIFASAFAPDARPRIQVSQPQTHLAVLTIEGS